MISAIMQSLGYRYLETKRKRTTDRFVICKGEKGYFYILVDERQLEGLSSRNDLEYIYRDIIKSQIKDVKMFKTLVEVRNNIK